MSSAEQTTGPRLLCPKHDGSKGVKYTAWLKVFIDALYGECDEDASLAETAEGTDPQQGLGGAQVKRRAKRRKQLYSTILQYLSDEDLQAVIRAEAAANGRTAMQILDRECTAPTSALEINKRILEWQQISITKDVGISASTITDLNRVLTRKNADLPAVRRYGSDEIVEKFLGAIITPPTLAKEADDLLQCPKGDLPARFYTQPQPAAVPPVVGGWERGAIVERFDELWRAAFARGELKFTSPTTQRDLGSSPSVSSSHPCGDLPLLDDRRYVQRCVPRAPRP